MADSVRTTVTELESSRVRVEAEVAPDEVQRRLEQAARALGREMRVPGFRRGKVPPPVVIRRVGRDAVLDEAVRESMGGWYSDAIDAAGIVPVGDPKLDMGELPGPREPLTFTIEIGVRPTATLGRYRGLEVGRREPHVDEEQIDAEIERLRERSATLETVDRPAKVGDFVVIDFRGEIDGEAFAGGEGSDQLVELGSGRLVPGFEEQLDGVSAGEEREVRVSFPDDYGAEHLAGREAVFRVRVDEVKEKTLPPVDDELAVEGGFDTLDELKDDVRTRLRETEEQAIRGEFQEAVLDAVVAEAEIDVPHELVHARAHELWERTVRTLAQQGISREAYLQLSGKEDEHELVDEAMPDAERALKREAVLAAVVEAEGIEPSEEELLEALEHSARHESTTPEKLLERLRSAHRLDALKEDLAVRRAVELVAEEAKPISVEQAKARDKLWTPEKGEAEAQAAAGEGGAGGRLWTPGS
jgi:trigger factor